MHGTPDADALCFDGVEGHRLESPPSDGHHEGVVALQDLWVPVRREGRIWKGRAYISSWVAGLG